MSSVLQKPLREELPEAGDDRGVSGMAPGSALVQVIEPPKRWVSIDWAELWQYRELFWFLVWRDIKVQYKQAVFGVGWAIVGPLAGAIIFAVLFGRVARLSTDGIAPTIFYLAGLTIWRFFAEGLTKASASLVGSSNLLTKVYFPRLIVPTAALMKGLVDFLIAFAVLILLLLFYGIVPAPTAVLLPVLVLIAMGTALGVGLFLGALNVKYRDVGHVVPFLVQLWMYVSVILPVSAIPKTITWGSWEFPYVHYVYALNPMVGVVEGFRWCLCHHVMAEGTEPPWEIVGVGVPVTIVLLVFGLSYFKRMERMFADII